MVRRSGKAAETGRHGAKLSTSLSADKQKRGFGGRRRRSGRNNDDDYLEEQKPGVLNLTNPLIPQELDEDIDDDLAFNSDDEEKYGQFFRKPAKPPAATRKSKPSKKSKSSANAADEDEEEALVRAQLRALGEIDNDEDLDFHNGDGGDDDDGEYIDLADMLGEDDDDDDNKKKSKNKSSSKDKQGKSAKKKKAKAVDEDGVAKKRRRAPVTEEAESIYGTAPATATASASAEGGQTFRRAMRDLLRSTGTEEASAEATTRLERVLKSKRNLIGVDMDDHTKALTLRSEVRATVAQDLDRYKSFLREQREAKHVQLPMPMPESNPVPSTLGAIAAAAEARFIDEAASVNPAILGHSSNSNNKGNRASALRLAGTVHNLLTSAGISRAQLHGDEDDDNNDGNVPFHDGDEENGDERPNAHLRRDTADAPTTSYMAKLKSMLSYENARRRRLNRIKSKTYRRIQRKEKEREKERHERAFELLHPEKARARLAAKLLKARVEERVTQKHKNTSKWVRHAKRFAQFDGTTQDAINEQDLAHQRLMQKMEEDAEEDEYLNAGHDDAGSQAASSEEERVVDFLIQEASGTKRSEIGAGNGQMDNINNNNNKNSKKSLTSVLWRSIDDDDDDNGAENGDGATGGDSAKANMTPTERARVDLREMKFMKQAREREETRYASVLDQLKEDIRRDMRGETILSEDEPSDLEENDNCKTAGEDKTDETKRRQLLSEKKKPLLTCAVGASGRRAFQTVKSPNGDVLERIVLKRPTGINAEHSIAEDADIVRNDEGTIHRNNAAEDNVSITDGDGSSSSGGHSRSPDEKEPHAGTQPSRAKGNRKLQAKEEPAHGGKAKSAMPDEFAGARTPGGGKSQTSSTRITILPTTNKRTRDDKTNDVYPKSDDKDPIPNESAKSKKLKTHHTDTTDENSLRMHQDYLIARAFAHDEVDEEFLAAKAAQVETVMKPIDKNATLPGWGEWGGTDERLNTRHQAKLKEIDLKRSIERTTLMKSRADAALDHVIINHDGVELVPDRMLLHMVPRPFSNATEFARSMRHPTGPEWNSAISFKDANQPRVEVRQGQAVMPLDLSLRGKKKVAKTTRRKNAKVAF